MFFKFSSSILFTNEIPLWLKSTFLNPAVEDIGLVSLSELQEISAKINVKIREFPQMRSFVFEGTFSYGSLNINNLDTYSAN